MKISLLNLLAMFNARGKNESAPGFKKKKKIRYDK